MTNEDNIIQLSITDLPLTSVDPHSPVPLYHQISLDLRRLIEQQIIPPGSILPPETEINQAYGVGRQTVRKAIARLVDDNLVERYAGKGTFVRDHVERANFQLDRSFSQHVRDMGLEPHSRVLSQEEKTIDADSPEAMKKWKGAPSLRLERVRYGDQEPICYQSSTVLTHHCPELGQHDFSCKSLYEVLAKEFNLIIVKMDHLIRAVAADDYRAELLELPPGSPLLFVATTAFLEGGQMIELSFSYYRAERYEYRTSEEWCD